MITEEQLKTGRILMVDDQVGSLCLLESVLSRLGFPRLRKLAHSQIILSEVDEFRPDLIITDLDMPELDGLQLVERVRAHLPRESCLPILVLTGSADSRAKRSSLMAGATDILFKPFDSSEMLMRVRNLLRNRFQHLAIQDQNARLEEQVAGRTAELADALAELKASERQVVQQERFRAFGEMAGGVVHDFNNALMSIIGYSTLLLQEEALLDDRALLRGYLQTMNTAGRDASHVVSRLRDFYRPREEGDVFVNVEINGLLEEVVPLTRPKWHDHALATGRVITLELELEKVPPILGNAAELREVLTNLIFNAVDAMRDGGKITLRSRPVRDAVQVEVADSGMGMSEETRARCLEPFFSTKGEGGTGLGLSMSHGIIRRHEGRMEIKSMPGIGTTFTLLLPSCDSAAAPDEPAHVPLGRSLRVLVVDDDPTTLVVVSQYLRSDGHEVEVVASGSEAMRRVNAEAFDLLITDHGMPGMSGLQLAEAARRFDPAMQVFLLTGFALDAAQLPASVCRILPKPLVPQALRAALREVFEPALEVA